MLNSRRIGAVQWGQDGGVATNELGVPIEHLKSAEPAAQSIEHSPSETSIDEQSLIYLANCGTGVGGARPKALVEESGIGYLAKFNSRL